MCASAIEIAAATRHADARNLPPRLFSALKHVQPTIKYMASPVNALWSPCSIAFDTISVEKHELFGYLNL